MAVHKHFGNVSALIYKMSFCFSARTVETYILRSLLNRINWQHYKVNEYIAAFTINFAECTASKVLLGIQLLDVTLFCCN